MDEDLFSMDWQLWQALNSHRLALVHLLEGFLDGGQVTSTLSAHLMQTGQPQLVGAFDVDELIQYRDRRPTMRYAHNRWQSIAEFELALYLLHDLRGHPFLLLRGLEPDLRWQKVSDQLVNLISQLDSPLVVTATGAPMAVPHTRPMTISTHATDESLIPADSMRWGGELEIPGSFAAYLELVLGEVGVDALGFHVHIPHYLAQAEYTPAAIGALNAIMSATGLELCLDPLPKVADDNLAAISAELADKPDVQQMIEAMEEQYDAEVTQQADVPSGDEIAAEFERFLAQRDETNE